MGSGGGSGGRSGEQQPQHEMDVIISQLRGAVRALRMRGLKQATKFASELLLGIPEEIRAQATTSCQHREEEEQAEGKEEQEEQGEEEEEDDWDRYDAARASFDSGEYLRAHHLLACAPMGKATRFLKHYALYLAGEKAKEEMDLQMSVSATGGGSSGASATGTAGKGALDSSGIARHGVNPHLKDLYVALRDAYHAGRLDGFGLYLFAVVLIRLGYTTTTGSFDQPLAHQQQDQEQDHEELRTTTTSTRAILLASIHQCPFNWSAWMELALLSPFTSNDDQLALSTASSYMFQLFQAHVLLDQQQNDAAQNVLDHLSLVFPHSTYLLAQQALTSYHKRDFDLAQHQFERLAVADPHRMDTMDVYSNVLYVKEDKAELSKLAHRSLQVDKYKPETCCIIGNYYSLKNKHDRAILYFHRALKLDPNFLSAWTLIGHEYVEMKNTSAAIEAYRKAVDLNARDYRAWYGLGQAYEILNMYLYSIYYYKKAASIRPYDARMWCALGGCYEKLAKREDAIACFERAVGNNDREGLASYQLGRILAATKGCQNEAAAYYQLHLGLRDVASVAVGFGGGGGGGGGSSSLRSRPALLPAGLSTQAIRLDTPQALAGVLFLANYFKQLGKYATATVFCNRLLDVQGPEKEEAKAMLREMRSLEASGGGGGRMF